MAYFTDDEFKCKDGCISKPMDPALLALLNALRSAYGKPIYITSGYRCDKQNKLVGGVVDSAHTTGHAVDVFCTSSRDRHLLLFHAIGLFKRIGVGTTFIHLDTDLTKDQEVIWLYGNH